MYCNQCGTDNADSATFCSKCGSQLFPTSQGQAPVPPPPPVHQQYQQPGGNYGQRPKIDNHMVFSILTTLFCCLIGGVIAIIYSSQVNTKLLAGDYDGALQSANNAKTWNIINLVVGGLGTIGYIAFFIFAAAAGSM